ncbi:MAG: hypothetical protein MN733_43235 [Nitrososphaera sp.]|nr:hypothetical protein [Nitrososphaera sp.]
MNDITKEQADLITDLETYKAVTGAKRFKRTQEEMAAGLEPEQALVRRLALARGEVQKLEERRQRATTSRSGDIVIRPAAGTDADYFEHVPVQPIECILDQNWYAWFDTLISGPFNGDANKLFTYILDLGIEEVLTKYHTIADVESRP